MKTEFLKQYYKDLDKLTLQDVKDKVAKAILNVESAKNISEIKGVKKLTGHKFAYRIKMGDYRIGLYIENDVVQFARIVHRKDIYKIFP